MHQQTARYFVGQFGEKQRLNGISLADAGTDLVWYALQHGWLVDGPGSLPS